MKRTTVISYWLARIAAAIILLQTLYFKFTAHPESVQIFSTVGMEPWGRIGVGVIELVAAVLLLVNATAWLGAALSAALMVGAVLMHLTWLGIEVRDDGGYLFFLALTVLVCSGLVLVIDRGRITMALKGIRKF